MLTITPPAPASKPALDTDPAFLGGCGSGVVESASVALAGLSAAKKKKKKRRAGNSST